jgi:hypothetical protein
MDYTKYVSILSLKNSTHAFLQGHNIATLVSSKVILYMHKSILKYLIIRKIKRNFLQVVFTTYCFYIKL